MIISVLNRVENLVGKGESACTSNFSFFPQCFPNASFPDSSKGVTLWEWVKYYAVRRIIIVVVVFWQQ